METINHECYVSLEVAKLLKQAGFDWGSDQGFTPLGEPCTWYNRKFIGEGLDLCEEITDECLVRPTLSIAQRWLREVKHIPISMVYGVSSHQWYCSDLAGGEYLAIQDTYESALEAGINKCLTLLLKEE